MPRSIFDLDSPGPGEELNIDTSMFKSYIRGYICAGVNGSYMDRMRTLVLGFLSGYFDRFRYSYLPLILVHYDEHENILVVRTPWKDSIKNINSLEPDNNRGDFEGESSAYEYKMQMCETFKSLMKAAATVESITEFMNIALYESVIKIHMKNKKMLVYNNDGTYLLKQVSGWGRSRPQTCVDFPARHRWLRYNNTSEKTLSLLRDGRIFQNKMSSDWEKILSYCNELYPHKIEVLKKEKDKSKILYWFRKRISILSIIEFVENKVNLVIDWPIFTFKLISAIAGDDCSRTLPLDNIIISDFEVGKKVALILDKGTITGDIVSIEFGQISSKVKIDFDSVKFKALEEIEKAYDKSLKELKVPIKTRSNIKFKFNVDEAREWMGDLESPQIISWTQAHSLQTPYIISTTGGWTT